MRRLRDRKKQTEVPETRSDVKPILPDLVRATDTQDVAVYKLMGIR